MKTAIKGGEMKRLIFLGLVAAVLAPAAVTAKVGGGDIVFKVNGEANVTYSHDTHVTKLGVKCRECHYQVFTTVEGHRRSTMADMQGGRSCGACHNGKRAFDVKTNCAKCHVH